MHRACSCCGETLASWDIQFQEKNDQEWWRIWAWKNAVCCVLGVLMHKYKISRVFRLSFCAFFCSGKWFMRNINFFFILITYNIHLGLSLVHTLAGEKFQD